jgi:hypothetical protein
MAKKIKDHTFDTTQYVKISSPNVWQVKIAELEREVEQLKRQLAKRTFLRLLFIKNKNDFSLISHKCYSKDRITGQPKNHLENLERNELLDVFRRFTKACKDLPVSCFVEATGTVSSVKNRLVFEADEMHIMKDFQKWPDKKKLKMSGLPIIRHKYLEQIGLDTNQFAANWNPLDDRQQDWHGFKEVYGFDERDTWGLDTTIKQFLYERLLAFKDIGCEVDGLVYVVGKRQMTLAECLDEMIEGLKLDLTIDAFAPEKKNKTVQKKIDNVFPILKACLSGLWW